MAEAGDRGVQSIPSVAAQSVGGGHGMHRLWGVGSRVALLAVAVTMVAGCDPWIHLPGSGGDSATCPVGSWTITSETITKPLSGLVPGLEITSSGPGVTLGLDSDHTWKLHADQTLTASLGSASGTVHVTGDASGTYTSTATAATFTLASVTGSATYTISAFGAHFSGTASLPSSGLSHLYGLSGTANYTCNSGDLSLGFPSFKMHGTDPTS